MTASPHSSHDTREEPALGAPDADSTAGPLAGMGTLLARDVAIALALLSLFAAADAWRVVTGTAFAGALSIANGLLAGFGVASLVHEWGHFAGARASGAGTTPKGLSSLQVFDFDYARSTPSQFQAMSMGGNVGHVLVVLLFAVALPLETPGRVALVAGAVGQAVFASSIEIPVIRKSMAGMPAAEALATIPRDFLRRNGGAGAIAALLVFAFL